MNTKKKPTAALVHRADRLYTLAARMSERACNHAGNGERGRLERAVKAVHRLQRDALFLLLETLPPKDGLRVLELRARDANAAYERLVARAEKNGTKTLVSA
ncbi:MAG: hypothetical protein LBC18_03215 [Opitutaceae bacterium]|jgi:hypothetical protein|nr:hypothetical protein [Opitutaceae bacterium]